MRSIGSFVNVALLVCSLSGAAQSQPTNPNKAQAQATLREGNALLDEGHAAEALAKFREAFRLFPSPKLYYNIGQAESLIPGHEVQAYRAMSRFLAEAKDANPELRKAAAAQQQQLRSKVGLVSVTGEPADADLLVDGANVGKFTREPPLALGVGTHKVMLKKDAAVSDEQTLTISGGATLEVRIKIRVASPPAPPPAMVSAPAPAPAPAPPAVPTPEAAPAPAHVPSGATAPASAPEPVSATGKAGPAPSLLALPVGTTAHQSEPNDGADRRWTWQRKTGVALAGVAAVSLVVAIVEHLQHERSASDFINAGCGTNDLSRGVGCRDFNDKYNSAQTGMLLGYLGAAVLGGGSAYFLLVSPTERAGGSGSGGVASITPGMTVNLQRRF